MSRTTFTTPPPPSEHLSPDVGSVNSKYNQELENKNLQSQIDAQTSGAVQDAATPKLKDPTSETAKSTLAVMANVHNLAERSRNRYHIGSGEGKFIGHDKDYNTSEASLNFSQDFSQGNTTEKEGNEEEKDGILGNKKGPES